MLNNLEATLQKLILAATSELAKQVATTVRESIAAEIIGAKAPSPAKKGPGRPKAAAPAAKPAPRAAATRLRRSPEEVAKDDAKLLEVVKANPGLRSVEIQKHIALAKQHVASGLERLRTSGKVKIKGAKSAATYTAV